ncbi:hypothetical protein [Candidatus Mesenet endosymbiont of Agriotes lineatus]|uniref:hypothetical protein n=1 Tax=Candidatus Mesenet endosymbiont of Agriotes lineatus TaxID=3077948 RepID=UPI0039773025
MRELYQKEMNIKLSLKIYQMFFKCKNLPFKKATNRKKHSPKVGVLKKDLNLLLFSRVQNASQFLIKRKDKAMVGAVFLTMGISLAAALHKEEVVPQTGSKTQLNFQSVRKEGIKKPNLV